MREVPTSVEALPFATLLRPGRLEPDIDRAYECTHFDSDEWSELSPDRLELDECAISSTVVSGGSYRRTRLTDVWWQGCRLMGTSWTDGRWTDVGLLTCSVAGVEAHGSEWRRVVFKGCKLDSVNLRHSTLDDVVFADCFVEDLDLSGAELSRLSFPGSTLSRLHLRETRKDGVDLRGVRSVDISDGLEQLSGVIVEPSQLVELAPHLARAVGLRVVD